MLMPSDIMNLTAAGLTTQVKAGNLSSSSIPKYIFPQSTKAPLFGKKLQNMVNDTRRRSSSNYAQTAANQYIGTAGSSIPDSGSVIQWNNPETQRNIALIGQALQTGDWSVVPKSPGLGFIDDKPTPATQQVVDTIMREYKIKQYDSLTGTGTGIFGEGGGGLTSLTPETSSSFDNIKTYALIALGALVIGYVVAKR